VLGKQIQKLRIAKGLSLSDLANRASVSKSYLSSIERDLQKNPSIKVLIKISSILEVTLNDLLENKANDETRDEMNKEWITFTQEMIEAGISKEQLNKLREYIDFLKWQTKKK
jgi:XRE family transcriptional regulator, master regulator for biofilm formation